MSGLVSAGELNRLIQIQSVSETRDSAGHVTETWAKVKDVWAKIEPLSGREVMAAKAEQVEVSHRLIVRYDAVLANPQAVAKCRAVYGARIFNLTASLNLDEDNRVIDILAYEGLNDG